MSELPPETLEALRDALAAYPDALRAAWTSGDNPLLDVALEDAGSDVDDHREHVQEIAAAALPILGGYGAGPGCRPEQVVAQSARGGTVLYTRGDA